MGNRTKSTRLAVAICAIGSLAACGDEPPPTSVIEFMEDSILLDATMVRCAQDGARTKYDAECLNAREAADRLAVAAEEARREELEAQSERKRLALRQAREMADEARRRASELKRLREEAIYLGLIEPLPEGGDGVDAAPPESVAADDLTGIEEAAAQITVTDLSAPAESTPATPAASLPPTELPPAVDLEAVRGELQQREADSPQPAISSEGPVTQEPAVPDQLSGASGSPMP